MPIAIRRLSAPAGAARYGVMFQKLQRVLCRHRAVGAVCTTVGSLLLLFRHRALGSPGSGPASSSSFSRRGPFLHHTHTHFSSSSSTLNAFPRLRHVYKLDLTVQLSWTFLRSGLRRESSRLLLQHQCLLLGISIEAARPPVRHSSLHTYDLGKHCEGRSEEEEFR